MLTAELRRAIWLGLAEGEACGAFLQGINHLFIVGEGGEKPAGRQSGLPNPNPNPPRAPSFLCQVPEQGGVGAPLQRWGVMGGRRLQSWGEEGCPLPCWSSGPSCLQECEVSWAPRFISMPNHPLSQAQTPDSCSVKQTNKQKLLFSHKYLLERVVS